MTFFNLEKEEVDEILEKMGYQLPKDYLEKNLKYYLARTSHGSSLSRVVHAQLANIIDDDQLSWELYEEALGSDYVDIQGGTTGEGIHTGVMASTVMIALTNYAGVNLHGEKLKVAPQLPKHWNSIKFNMQYRGVKYQFVIDKKQVQVNSDKEVVLEIVGKDVSLIENKQEVITY
jgi:trehalose/maltose hydrolase-like predicted phosphorylase